MFVLLQGYMEDYSDTYISHGPDHVFCNTTAIWSPGTFFTADISLTWKVIAIIQASVSNLTFKLYTNTHHTFSDIYFPLHALKCFLFYFLGLLFLQGELV